MKLSPWAIQAMGPEARTLALRLRLDIQGKSPKGPWALRHPQLARREGNDIDALVLAAAKEITQ